MSRTAGTPNAKTMLAREKALELGVDPFEILCLFAKGDWKALGYDSGKETRYGATGMPYEVDKITLDHRILAAKEAAKYTHPQLKATEFKLPKGAKAVIKVGWGDEENEDTSPAEDTAAEASEPDDSSV